MIKRADKNIENFNQVSTLSLLTKITRCDVFLKVCLRLALIFLVLLQSFVVVADAHKLHQSSNEHQTTFDHVGDDAGDVVTASTSTSNALDCQHCCHCHSSMGSLLPASIPSLGLNKPHYSVHAYPHQLPSKMPSSLYRPPIA